MPARRGPDLPRRDLAVAGLAAVGLVVAGYLSWLKWSGASALFCTPGTGCDIVQASRYAMLVGVPTALMGAALYFVIGALALAGLDRARWRLAFILAAAGVGFSGYLTYLSLVELKAACIWCLASTVIMVLSLGALALRRPATAPKGRRLAALAAGAALLAIVGGAFVFAGGPPPATPYQEALAKHLARSGAVFYGAYWCPHCQEQKELFGSAAAQLPYVECDPKGRHPQTSRCEGAGVRVFPTWVFGAERREGVQRLEDLAKASGFK
ncbi:MAG TPA: vitamin K epoxide reductase family protein [Methylomirabilota bacterium]|nr:vitamin K epoxide reductase family protein [Methylomirabilota bacterium]